MTQMLLSGGLAEAVEEAGGFLPPRCVDWSAIAVLAERSLSAKPLRMCPRTRKPCAGTRRGSELPLPGLRQGRREEGWCPSRCTLSIPACLHHRHAPLSRTMGGCEGQCRLQAANWRQGACWALAIISCVIIIE